MNIGYVYSSSIYSLFLFYGKLLSMKLTWKGYWKPTPKNIRKVADSLLGAATLASTFSCVYDRPTLGVVVMVIAVVTKIVSNFLSDDESIN